MSSQIKIGNFTTPSLKIKIPEVYIKHLDSTSLVNLQDLIIELNSVAGVRKAAFDLDGLHFFAKVSKVYEGMNTSKDRGYCQWFTIRWTGYEFRLCLSNKLVKNEGIPELKHDRFITEKSEDYCYPILSEAAFEDFFNSVYHENLSFIKSFRGDIIDTYRKMATGQIHRLPKGFWKEIDEDFQKTFIEYFLRFCCGFNERTVIDLKITHLKRWKLMPFMSGSSGRKFSLYEMVSMVYPEIKPWEMIYVSRGTYASSDNVMNTLRYIMDIYALESPEDLKFSHIMKIAPGVISYIKNTGGIDEVRKLLANTNTK